MNASAASLVERLFGGGGARGVTAGESPAALADWLHREGITDQRVLSAIEAVPRALFMPPGRGSDAYRNAWAPIGLGQVISTPFAVALQAEALELTPRARVLEVGTGSGYAAAVLSRLAGHVYTIERHASLLAQARERFVALGLDNITARLGDGTKGWSGEAQFDRICVSCGHPNAMPPALLASLTDCGIMVAPVGTKMLRIRRRGDRFESEPLDDMGGYSLLVEGMPQ